MGDYPFLVRAGMTCLVMTLVFMCPVTVCMVFDRSEQPFSFFLGLAGFSWVIGALCFACFALTHIW